MKTKQKQAVSIFILFVLIFIQLAYPQSASAASIIRVIPGGSVSVGCGDTWVNACDLQYALTTVALSGDEIWVKQGTYTPGPTRDATFTLKNGVAVYGGFLGNETVRISASDQSLTILSGEIGLAGNSDNSYHVVTVDAVGVGTILNGFTIRDGNANGTENFGGGIYMSFQSNATLTNITVTNNTAGSGGGLAIFGGSSPLITNASFTNNSAPFTGGGVLIQDSTPNFLNVVISGNSSSAEGGGFTNNYSDSVLTNVTFSNNSVVGGPGGGLMNNHSAPVLTDVLFNGNTVTGGGAGSYNYYSNPILNNVTFTNNIAGRRGGGLGNENSNPILTNVTFSGNSATQTVGASPWGGGGMYNENSNPVLKNVTFGGNSSSLARAMSNSGTSTLQISNSIFWDGGANEFSNTGSGSINILYSIVQGGCPIGATCTDVVANDPLLGILANNGGVTQTMALGVGSPAINAGNNGTCATTDQRGVTRPQGSACDMGAYEAGVLIDTVPVDFSAGTLGSCVVDNAIGNGALKLNLPSTSCVFTSRVHNANGLVDWTSLTSTATLPTGTSISFEARSGNTPSPDALWTNWQSANGTLTNPGSQYIQYRVTLSTTDSGQTPVLEDVKINFTNGNISTLISPDGPLTTWNGSFSWTGVSGATWYLLEVYTNGGTRVLYKWYTSAQTNCAVGTACTLTPSTTDLNLGNGAYQWRVMDYGAYGYGIWTYFKPFSLTTACYTLTANVSPANSATVTVPSQSCSGGYTAGTVVQLKAVPATGYAFSSWSGDLNSTTNPVSITMDGNKSVTANMRGNTPLTPSGTANNWNYSFTWTGLSNATWYLIEVQTSGGTQVFYKWYTSAQTNCSGGTACSVTPSGLSLADGDYKWYVLDYGAYGYGINSAFKTFTLSGAACYSLTKNASPALSGVINTPAQTCPGGFTAGSVIQLVAVPNTGYLFNNWSGDAGGSVNTISVTMNGNKNVTANFKATPALTAPSGSVTNWNKTFTWTGLNNATWYLVEVYTSGGTQVFYKWYTSSQTQCAGGTACSVTASELNLPNGTYKWRILDYGAYGYGTFTSYLNFTLN
jgi:hypothetical protein